MQAEVFTDFQLHAVNFGDESRNRAIVVLRIRFDIEAMFRHMEKNRDIGVLGPRLVRPDGSVDESCYAFPTPLTPVARRTPLGRVELGRREVNRYLMAGYDRRATREVDWLLGAVLMVRREAMERVGHFDERYFLYFEDTDWSRRFREAGWRVVYFAGSEMVHLHERLTAGSPWYLAPLNKAARIHLTSCVKYFLKWRKAERAGHEVAAVDAQPETRVLALALGGAALFAQPHRGPCVKLDARELAW